MLAFKHLENIERLRNRDGGTARGTGGPSRPLPDFGRSVNPIASRRRGADFDYYLLTLLLPPPHIFISSVIPEKIYATASKLFPVSSSVKRFQKWTNNGTLKMPFFPIY